MRIRDHIFKLLTKKAFLMGFFCLSYFVATAQDQKLSDSLAIVYNNKEYKKSDELKILKLLAASETDTDKKLSYSSLLIEKAKKIDSVSYVFTGLLQQGNAFRKKGDLTKALEVYFEAANLASRRDLKDEGARINIAIADVYSIMGNFDTSVQYYREAMKLLKQNNDSINLASAQLNLGDEYFNQKKLDSALYYFSASGKIFKALKYELGEAYNLGNVGLVYAEKGENEKAEENLNSSIEVLTKYEDYYPICVYLNAISEIYVEKGLNTQALKFALKSLELAKKYGLKDQISDSNLKLSQFYEKAGDIQRSFDFYKEHIVFRDSVKTIKDVQKMANVRTTFEVSQKQVEVDLLNEQKKTQRIIAIAIAIAMFLIGLLAIALFKRNRFILKTSKIIESEKKRSDDLLKNILPDETALELKENGTVKAKKFESVSVLFTDFKDFTKYSESLNPEELVKSIDYYFTKFDSIIGKYGLEKIKTVGDAYVCAGGLPFPSDDHVLRISMAALDIVDFVKETKNSNTHKLAKFDIRVGINTGPVVAGVVGTKKFSYDIWGDTVNVASRMESSGEIGMVNISEVTYNLLKKYEQFVFEPRGAIEAKGKGKVQMYFVKQRENHVT